MAKLVAGDMSSRDEEQLYLQHAHHFRRRVEPLDISFFPGLEKSGDAIASLGNGAYASFRNEPNYRDRPAFHHAFYERLNPLNFLYYWRASATIQYLRQEGPDVLRARANLQRNVRLALKQGFIVAGRVQGETLWSLPEWRKGSPQDRPPDVDNLQVDVTKQRGREAIRAIFSAAGCPLTRAEIAYVLERAQEFARESPVATEHLPAVLSDDDAEARILSEEIATRTRALFEKWSAEDRALLRARGYADNPSVLKPFREVAREMGRLTPERWRQKEKLLLESLRESFEPSEIPVVAQTLGALLGVRGIGDA